MRYTTGVPSEHHHAMIAFSRPLKGGRMLLWGTFFCRGAPCIAFPERRGVGLHSEKRRSFFRTMPFPLPLTRRGRCAIVMPQARGIRSVAGRELPKLKTRVRFPHPAPEFDLSAFCRLFFWRRGAPTMHFAFLFAGFCLLGRPQGAEFCCGE